MEEFISGQQWSEHVLIYKVVQKTQGSSEVQTKGIFLKPLKKKAEDRAESLRVRISPLPTLAQGSGEIFEKQSSFGKGNVWLWIIT